MNLYGDKNVIYIMRVIGVCHVGYNKQDKTHSTDF